MTAFGDESTAVRFKQLEDELTRRRDAVTCAFLQMLDLRDFETGIHCTRLAEWALRIAERMSVADDKLADIETAALLHDLGKVGIADAILHKAGPLNEAEIVELRRHSEYGWLILRAIPGFESVALYTLHHHERIDGLGYPAGIAGDEIPIGARIVAVIDAFDAMVSERCYRSAVPVDEALRRLHEGAGTQFDAAIVREFALIADAELFVVQSAVADGRTGGADVLRTAPRLLQKQ